MHSDTDVTTAEHGCSGTLTATTRYSLVSIFSVRSTPTAVLAKEMLVVRSFDMAELSIGVIVCVATRDFSITTAGARFGRRGTPAVTERGCNQKPGMCTGSSLAKRAQWRRGVGLVVGPNLSESALVTGTEP